MDKCSCGHYEWHENTGEDLEDFGPSAWYHNWPCDGGDYNNNIFCFKCGDELLPDGRIIARQPLPSKLMDMLKELGRDAQALRIIQKHKIEIYCDDGGVFQIEEQQINGRRIGLGHPMGEDLAALVLKHYQDILDAEDEMEATE